MTLGLGLLLALGTSEVVAAALALPCALTEALGEALVLRHTVALRVASGVLLELPLSETVALGQTLGLGGMVVSPVTLPQGLALRELLSLTLAQ